MVCRKRRNVNVRLHNGQPFLLQFLSNSYHNEIITSLRSVGLRQPTVDVRSGSQISLILKFVIEKFEEDDGADLSDGSDEGMEVVTKDVTVDWASFVTLLVNILF